MARIGEGRMRIYLGEPTEGMAMLDAAFVTLEAGEIGPVAAGDAYCTIIDGCAEVQDLVRLRAWTDGLTRWCDAQQELVLYRGHCLVHRAEVFRELGDWAAGLEEARRACDRLAEPVMYGIIGAAHALEGDFQRLLGSFDAARASYERATELGTQPQPGLALLRLAEGDTAAAHAMIQRVLAESEDPISRSRPLAAAVEIALAAGELDTAAKAADELRATAGELGSALLRARAAYAEGAVLLARDDVKRAIAELRRCLDGFNALEMRADAARARLLIAECCDALDDTDGAETERRTAQATLMACAAPGDKSTPDGLSLPRSRSASAGCAGQDEPRHRRRAVHQREDSGEPRQPHLHQARRQLSLGCNGLCLRPQGGLRHHHPKDPRSLVGGSCNTRRRCLTRRRASSRDSARYDGASSGSPVITRTTSSRFVSRPFATNRTGCRSAGMCTKPSASGVQSEELGTRPPQATGRVGSCGRRPLG